MHSYNNNQSLNNEEKNRNQANQNIEQRTNRKPKKPWYNQGWLWLIVTVIAMGVFIFMFQGLTEQIGQLTEATQNQTDAIERQNNILAGMKEKMNDMIVEFNRMSAQIAEAIRNMKSA